MNGLRQDVIDAMVKHFEDQRGHPPEQMQIKDLTDYADAVLRVLAEHGDTQQVREQLVSSGALALPRGDRINAVMAVVAPRLAARDAAVERAEHKSRLAAENHYRADRAEADLAAARQQLDQVRAEWQTWIDAAAEPPTVAEWDSVIGERDAANDRVQQVERSAGVISRQRNAAWAQLDQIRLMHSKPTVIVGATALPIIYEKTRRILDAPARPAGHDETGQ